LRFRKKPVVIEAVQWNGNWSEMLRFVVAQGGAAHTEGDLLLIQTLEGKMVARPGWWIIRGVKGEFYPCEPEIFEETYEPART